MCDCDSNFNVALNFAGVPARSGIIYGGRKLARLFLNNFSQFLLRSLGLALLLFLPPINSAQVSKLIPVTNGWAKNQVNAVIFRRNSLITHGKSQFIAFYDELGRIVLAKRSIDGSRWTIRVTQYLGHVKDAHKSISIAIDGKGYLHMVWNQHNNELQYVRSLSPGSLELTAKSPMLGSVESRVTYPEFYNLNSGNLLFLYRDGSSGRGNLLLNRYDVRTQKWSRVQDKLIDGEEKRSAYWQSTVDSKGSIHISWVWRETPDVASNHDLCYAVSHDEGKTWRKSSGEIYQLPVTASTAEYVQRIPEKSELINQTSMAADDLGRPYIVTYWNSEGTGVPQYNLVYFDGREWRPSQVSQRTTPFSLSGMGTRRIPISRPQIVVRNVGLTTKAYVIFRDSERGDRVSVAVSNDVEKGVWTYKDLTTTSVGMWEPTLDSEAWRLRKAIHLLVQRVGQGQGEGLEELPPQLISVLEWKP